MMLSDGTIRRYIEEGSIVIDPYDPDLIQPASLDIRLGDGFWQIEGFKQYHHTGNYIIIKPGLFILGTTLERIELPSYIAARVEGKSSLGRKGLQIHSTAGFIDPGFRGQVTLELSLSGSASMRLDYGMKIGQISFFELDMPAERPYGSDGLGSKYQDQVGTTLAR